MDYLRVGFIKKTHGLKGELSVLPLTDNPKRFKKIKKVYLCLEDQYKEFSLSYANVTAKDVIVKFAEVDNIEQAQQYVNKYITINKQDGVDLGEWEFYTQDIIGCSVEYDGKQIGTVIDVLNSGANDNMLVKTNDEKEIYYPFVRDFIVKVDIPNKIVVINQTEDFFDI